MGRMHSYRDYNITLWVDYKDNEWEYLSVVSGPMSGGNYKTLNLTGSTQLPTAEDAYEQAQEAAIQHIDRLSILQKKWA